MTIGLGANDYWFIGQRTIVPPCLPWLPPFPRTECFSVLYLIARVIGLYLQLVKVLPIGGGYEALVLATSTYIGRWVNLYRSRHGPI